MIQTDFILVRDGEELTRISVSEKAKLFRGRFFQDDPDESDSYLRSLGYTVTVLDRATMTRDEQREVFMLTKDVSFLSYETVCYWMTRSDKYEEYFTNHDNSF